MREFLYVGDMAAASIYVMNLAKAIYDQHTDRMQSHINVGYGSDIAIGDVAKTIARVIGFTGAIDFDPSKPDGSPKKLMDSSRINALGWHAKVDLEAGLRAAYTDFLEHCI